MKGREPGDVGREPDEVRGKNKYDERPRRGWGRG